MSWLSALSIKWLSRSGLVALAVASPLGFGNVAFAAKNIGRPGIAPSTQVETNIDAADEEEHAADAVLDRMMGHFGRTLSVMQRAFPEDWQRFVGLLSVLADAGGSEAIMYDAAALSLDQLAEERHGLLGGASDEAMTATIMAKSNFVDMVNYRLGDAVCASYVGDGAKALTESGGMLPFAAEIDTKFAVLYDAFSTAKDGRPAPETASEADFDAFKAYVLTLGGREEQLVLIDRPPQAGDEDVCSGVILMLEAAGTMPGPTGTRVRWTIGQNTVEFH